MSDTVRKVSVETLASPLTYTPDQIRKAYDVAYSLKRGAFVLCEPPRRA